MPITDPNAIKKIVHENFNGSAELYDKFESQFGLFEALTMELAMESDLRSGMSVCDVGCGTGTSSFVLSQLVGPNGHAIGVDFSEEMLALANKKMSDSSKSNLDFILCDANELEDNINSKLDCVLYNACIFLIPEPQKTLQSAYRLLKDHGVVAMNYLVGIYDQLYEEAIPDCNLFEGASYNNKSFAPYGRAITDVQKLPEILNTIGYHNLSHGIVSIELPLTAIETFYSIPAQSAALWPKHSYDERLSMLGSLLDYFREANIEKYFHYWGWCVGEK